MSLSEPKVERCEENYQSQWQQRIDRFATVGSENKYNYLMCGLWGYDWSHLIDQLAITVSDLGVFVLHLFGTTLQQRKKT